MCSTVPACLTRQITKAISSIHVFHKIIQKKALFLLPLVSFYLTSPAQDGGFLKLRLEDAVQMALENHPELTNAQLAKEAAIAQQKDILQLPPTELNMYYGQINSAIRDYSWKISQGLGSVPQHIIRHQRHQQQVTLAEADIERQKAIIARAVKQAYLNLAYHHEVLEICFRQKELYDDLKRIAHLRYEHGEYSLLEKMTAETRQAEIENQYHSQQDEVQIHENSLKALISTDKDIVPTTDVTFLYEIAKKDSGNYRGNAYLQPYALRSERARLEVRESKAAFFPELSVGYFHQQIDGITGFNGIVAGASFPLWFLTPQSQIRQQKIEHQIARNNYQHQKQQVETAVDNLILDLHKYFRQLQHYMDHALPNANELINTARLQFENEEIDYVEYIQALNLAFDIEQKYLDIIKYYNQTAIALEFYAQ